MPAMQKKPFLCPDKGISPDKKRQVNTSLEESSSTLKRSPRCPLEGFPPSTKDIAKCLVRRNHKGYPDTPSRIILLNYSLEPLHHYLVDSFPSPRAKSLKHKNL